MQNEVSSDICTEVSVAAMFVKPIMLFKVIKDLRQNGNLWRQRVELVNFSKRFHIRRLLDCAPIRSHGERQMVGGRGQRGSIHQQYCPSQCIMGIIVL